MKLNEKGCSKLGKVFQGFPLPPHIFVRFLDCDFEHDDFETTTTPKEVRLSIDEAKLVAHSLVFGGLEMMDLDKEIRYKSLALDIERQIEQIEAQDEAE